MRYNLEDRSFENTFYKVITNSVNSMIQFNATTLGPNLIMYFTLYITQ